MQEGLCRGGAQARPANPRRVLDSPDRGRGAHWSRRAMRSRSWSRNLAPTVVLLVRAACPEPHSSHKLHSSIHTDSEWAQLNVWPWTRSGHSSICRRVYAPPSKFTSAQPVAVRTFACPGGLGSWQGTWSCAMSSASCATSWFPPASSRMTRSARAANGQQEGTAMHGSEPQHARWTKRLSMPLSAECNELMRMR